MCLEFRSHRLGVFHLRNTNIIYEDPKILVRSKQIFESRGFKKATCPTKMKTGFKTASFAAAKVSSSNKDFQGLALSFSGGVDS